MKAAILQSKGVMTYAEIPTPAPRPGYVLLQVKASSICGSDLMRYTKGHKVLPLVLGHETAGVVTQVGEGVSASWVGKRAAIIPLMPCFECEQCRAGRYSACGSYAFIGSRVNGGYAEYVELPERNLLPISDAVSFESAALIEPATVARHILDLGEFQPGQSAVVLGAGSIGLMTIQWLRILGAGRIVALDVVDANLAAAQALGAHAVINTRTEDLKERVRATLGAGADLALETAGSPQTLAQTLQVTRPRGWVVLAGNQPLDAALTMQFFEDMMRKELRMAGCFMSYSGPFPGHEWTDAAAALDSGQLDMSSMISHRFPLAQTPQVFADLAAHAYAHRKIILLPEEA